MKSNEDDAPNAQSRGPVIMKNVLPPTPPASSAPPEVQDKPLDLSCSHISIPFPKPNITVVKTVIPVTSTIEDKAEVEIIAMRVNNNNNNNKIVPPPPERPVGFQPPPQQHRQQQQHHPHPYHHYQHHQQQQQRVQQQHILQQSPQRPDRNKPSIFRAYQGLHPHHHHHHQQQQQQHSIAIPIRVPEPTYPEWSRPINPTNYRPPTTAPSQQTNSSNRHFVVPPLRPLPQHWNALAAAAAQNQRVQSQVQLHPVGQQQQMTTPRVFHPLQIVANRAASIEKKLPTQHSPPRPVPAITTPATYTPEWGVRSCVVCQRQADFRCAGCHGNAYCSKFLFHSTLIRFYLKKMS